MGLAQSGIVTVRAKRPTTGHAVDRDSAQDRCEFEGECLDRSRKSCERLSLETFDIDFGKNRLAITFDQLVKGDCRSNASAGRRTATLSSIFSSERPTSHVFGSSSRSRK